MKLKGEKMKNIQKFGWMLFVLVFMLGFTAQVVRGEGGLIGKWSFDGDAKDSSGNGNDGIIKGATFVDGKFGKALSLDGVDDYVLVSDSSRLNIIGDVTVELWAKRNQFNTGNMLSKGAGAISGIDAPSAYLLEFKVNALQAAFEDASGRNYLVTGPAVTDSSFHHYAYVRSGSTHKLYMDGDEVASAAFTGTPGDTSGISLSIGAWRQESSFIEHFNGLIDEVRIYNRALTASEIQASYSAIRPTTAPTVTPATTCFDSGMGASGGNCIYSNGNVGGVYNNPTSPTTFTLTNTYNVMSISTYHYNSGSGATPGTISLKDSSGKTVGTWTATGRYRNFYWDVTPNINLGPGTYTVIDSDTSTWAQNSETKNQGMFIVKGTLATTTGITPSVPVTPSTTCFDNGMGASGGNCIYSNGNVGGVYNNPTSPTTFTLTNTYNVMSISTYHYNSGRGATPGTISLKDSSGKTVGTWTATGRYRNFYWDVTPNIKLGPGTYTVIDSDTSTWAQNSETKNQGMFIVKGTLVSSAVTSTTGTTPEVGAYKKCEGTEPYLYIDDRNMGSGKTVELPVIMCNAANLANMDFTLNYDSSALKIKDAIKGSLNAKSMFDWNPVSAGKLKLSFASKDGMSGSGSIAVLIFDVIGKTGAKSSITGTVTTASKTDGGKISLTVNPGKFSVEASTIKGDCDGDNELTERDALAALQMSVEKRAVSMCFDYNGDGSVDSSDAREMMKAIVGSTGAQNDRPNKVESKTKSSSLQYERPIKQPVKTTAGDRDVAIGDLNAQQVRVDVPGGTFNTGTVITLVSPESVPSIDSSEGEFVGSPVDISAGDKPVRLNRYVTVTMKVDKSKLSGDTQAGAIWAAYYDGKGKQWVYFKPDKVDLQAGTITFTTDHFTNFGNVKLTVDERIEKYTHSATLAEMAQAKTDDKVNQLVDAAVGKMLKDGLKLDEESYKSKILSSLLKNPEYQDMYDSLKENKVDEEYFKNLNSLLGEALLDNVPESVVKERLGALRDDDGVGYIEAVSQAAGAAAEGNYRAAAQYIGSTYAEKFIPVKATKIAIELMQHQIDNWRDDKVESAYKIYKDGKEKDSFIGGVSVDPGDFEGMWDQMNALAERLQGEAVEKEIKIRREGNADLPTDTELDFIRNNVKRELKKQFEARAKEDKEVEEREAKLKKAIKAYQGTSLLTASYFFDNADMETRLDKLLRLRNRILLDTKGNPKGLVVTDNDIIEISTAYFSGTTVDGKKKYAELLKKKFGVDLSKKKRVGSTSTPVPSTTTDCSKLQPGQSTLDCIY